jgi:hypothetical protein
MLTDTASTVSCAPGSSFCMAVANLNNVWTVMATADEGASWHSYTTLPAKMGTVKSVSCPVASVCWVAGEGDTGAPVVVESQDGGQTWTDRSLTSWTNLWMLWSIDCVSATTCWAAGSDQEPVVGYLPLLLETTDGGADWTQSTNLPVIPPTGIDGTYQLFAISCVSPLACVAGGGILGGNGSTTVISTTDGGETWSLSTDPILTGLQDILGMSCANGTGGLPTCYAAVSANEAAGPVVISSTDGGATWGGMETYDNNGWMNSISCPDAAHCWATGGNTTVGLVGTADGGNTWTVVTSDTPYEAGSVSCASVTFCVSTTDNGLWQTTSGGGLRAEVASHAAHPAHAAAVGKPAVMRLPKLSGPTVSALAGQNATVTGKSPHGGTASVQFTLPTGKVTTGSAAIGLNGYYTVTVAHAPKGATTVKVSVRGKLIQTVVVHGYPAPAPAVSSLSAHAGPAAGGAVVTVKGTNFRHVTGVYFGSSLIRTVNVISPTELTVTAPAGKQAVYLSVVTRDGGPSALTGRSVYNFLTKPALTTLTPGAGPATGGTTVTISGSGFAFVKYVYFGTRAASRVQVLSSREIKVTAPAGSGSVPVKVVTAGGTSPVVNAGYFSY